MAKKKNDTETPAVETAAPAAAEAKPEKAKAPKAEKAPAKAKAKAEGAAPAEGAAAQLKLSVLPLLISANPPRSVVARAYHHVVAKSFAPRSTPLATNWPSSAQSTRRRLLLS